MLIEKTDKETLPPMNKERMGLSLRHLVPTMIPVPVQEEKTEEGLGVAASGDQEFVVGRSKTA